MRLPKVVGAGVAGLRQAWQAAEAYNGEEDWIGPLLELAQELQELYGNQGTYLDYSALAAEVQRDQRRLADLEEDAHSVRLKVTRPRYRQLHPPQQRWRRRLCQRHHHRHRLHLPGQRLLRPLR